METSELKNGSFTRAQIESIVKLLQNYLTFDGNKFALLMAIAENESGCGYDNVFRFEYSYSRSSLAFKRSKILQNGYELWGDMCAGSWGPWQILWSTAAEQGYPVTSNPQDLADPQVSLPFVIKFINKLIIGGAKTVEDIGVCYNGGLGALKAPVGDELKYAKKLRIQYDYLDPRS